MRMILILAIVFVSSIRVSAQKNHEKLSLGLRSTISAFGHEDAVGQGVGGQFRFRLSDKINTEWFADYIRNDIGGLGNRVDGHIGWSVMFYPFDFESKFEPYLLAGHCFDYTRVSVHGTGNGYKEMAERWSSAVQMGVGSHYRLTERLDLSLSGQYMMHLGDDIHAHVHTHGTEQELHISEGHGASAEGHLLFTLSMNIILF